MFKDSFFWAFFTSSSLHKVADLWVEIGTFRSRLEGVISEGTFTNAGRDRRRLEEN